MLRRRAVRWHALLHHRFAGDPVPETLTDEVVRNAFRGTIYPDTPIVPATPGRGRPLLGEDRGRLLVRGGGSGTGSVAAVYPVVRGAKGAAAGIVHRRRLRHRPGAELRGDLPPPGPGPDRSRQPGGRLRLHRAGLAGENRSRVFAAPSQGERLTLAGRGELRGASGSRALALAGGCEKKL